jgi:hypothetical protein
VAVGAKCGVILFLWKLRNAVGMATNVSLICWARAVDLAVAPQSGMKFLRLLGFVVSCGLVASVISKGEA